MRLGDLDRIAQDVRDNNIENYYKQDWTSSQIVTLLENAPTISAVPVVRCQECKYHKPIDYCTKHKQTGWFDDDFCRRGQRKEAEHGSEFD